MVMQLNIPFDLYQSTPDASLDHLVHYRFEMCKVSMITLLKVT